ncbi:MAG: gamma-glutamyl-gamma-aminobutyrate hydrolase family protein [Planctomycetota bacterium]
MTASGKRVLILQHAEPEGPGRILRALREVGVGHVLVRSDLGEAVPRTLDGFGGLVLMGGPQGVYEEHIHPFLRAERELVEHGLASRIPILGVCLGSQILANALGSPVKPGGRIELGWRPVSLSAQTSQDSVLQHLPAVFTPFHWHGDVYPLPSSTLPVGSSEMTAVQGFVLDSRVYGLLFHLEVAERQVAAMAEAFPGDVRRAGLDTAGLMSDTARHAPGLEVTAMKVFRSWAMLV